MIRSILDFAGGFIQTALGSDVSFTADNRLDPGGLGLGIKFNGPKHIPMVGNSHGRHFVLVG